jgi:hypothetical protein
MSEKLGPTGDYPRGKSSEDDEGGLVLKISSPDDTVRVEFGTPTAWIALDADAALAFASGIIDHAMRLKFAGAQMMIEATRQTKQ